MAKYKRIHDLNKDWLDNELVLKVATDGTASYRSKNTNWKPYKPTESALANAEASLGRDKNIDRVVVLLDDEARWDSRLGELE